MILHTTSNFSPSPLSVCVTHPSIKISKINACDWRKLLPFEAAATSWCHRSSPAEGQERLLFVKIDEQIFGRTVKLPQSPLCWNPYMHFVPLMPLIASPHGRIPGCHPRLIFLPLLAAGPPLCSPSGCLIKGAPSNEITPWGLMVWLIDRHTAGED